MQFNNFATLQPTVLTLTSTTSSISSRVSLLSPPRKLVIWFQEVSRTRRGSYKKCGDERCVPFAPNYFLEKQTNDLYIWLKNVGGVCVKPPPGVRVSG